MKEENQAKLKAELLSLAEDLSVRSVKSVFAIAKLCAEDSENKIDDNLIPFLPALENAVIKALDNISK